MRSDHRRGFIGVVLATEAEAGQPDQRSIALPSASVTIAFQADVSLFPDRLGDAHIVLTHGSDGHVVELHPPFGAPQMVEAGAYKAELFVGGRIALTGSVEIFPGQAATLDIHYHGEPLRVDADPPSTQTAWMVKDKSGQTVLLSGLHLDQTVVPGVYIVTAKQGDQILSQLHNMAPNPTASGVEVVFESPSK